MHIIYLDMATIVVHVAASGGDFGLPNRSVSADSGGLT
jgi:hypothetical protein